MNAERIDLNTVTKSELLAIPDLSPNETFTEVIIVPTGKKHDSGFGGMRYVLVKDQTKIVGAVGGGSDCIHINGFGGHGASGRKGAWVGRTGPVLPWRIDCLKTSGCLRLFCGKELELDGYNGTSDFWFVVKE